MDRRPNVGGEPVPQDQSTRRPAKTAREQETANVGFDEREEVREDGGIGYTEEGKNFDRTKKAEEGEGESQF